MPHHTSVSKHGRAAAHLVAVIEETSRQKVSFICRTLAEEIGVRARVLYPEAQAALVPPSVEKKAASLRRQWYRWKSGEHSPSTDDLAALLAIARREGWISERDTAHGDLPVCVAGLIETVDADEAGRWNQHTADTLDAMEPHLLPVADYMIELSLPLKAGVLSVGLVIDQLSRMIFKRLDGTGLPPRTWSHMENAATVISNSWQEWAASLRESHDYALQLHEAMHALSVPELREQFESHALKHGFWPEEFSSLMRHLMHPREAALPGWERAEQFRQLLVAFTPRQKIKINGKKDRVAAKVARARVPRTGRQ